MRSLTANDVLVPGTLVKIKKGYDNYDFLDGSYTGVVIEQSQEELNKLSGAILNSEFRVFINRGISKFYWYELEVE